MHTYGNLLLKPGRRQESTVLIPMVLVTAAVEVIFKKSQAQEKENKTEPDSLQVN